MEPSSEDTLGAAAGSCSASLYDSLNDFTGGRLSEVNQKLDSAFSKVADLTVSAAETVSATTTG
jgi:hypothetical protein